MSVVDNPWFSHDDAATYVGVTRRTLDRYRTEGLLPAYRVGGRRQVRFRREDLDALFQPIAS